MTKPQPRIVCAAIRTKSYGILVGPRHLDATMRAPMELMNIIAPERHVPDEFEDQGFIDQYGEYYSRTEAWKVAEAAGQIAHRCGGDTRDGGTLFSENLY